MSTQIENTVMICAAEKIKRGQKAVQLRISQNLKILCNFDKTHSKGSCTSTELAERLGFKTASKLHSWLLAHGVMQLKTMPYSSKLEVTQYYNDAFPDIREKDKWSPLGQLFIKEYYYALKDVESKCLHMIAVNEIQRIQEVK